MLKTIQVKRPDSSATRTVIRIDLKLSKKDRDELEALLDRIGYSINNLVRYLILDELLEERIHYNRR
jgi:hypothetical protein